MSLLNHWHPVLLSSALRQQPVPVRIDGRDLVLYRASTTEIGCLDDYCPHRRMKLSVGKVIDGRLQCKYHGWTYGVDGQGESPGTPKLHACAKHYETREAHGAIWVKPRGIESPFPDFTPVNGYFPMCTLAHVAEAPLEVTLDNFCEIEHTPTTHAIFGYELDRMPEVQVRFEPTESTVRVVNHGPPKQFHWALRKLLGIGKDYLFYDDWTTYFSPLYSIYDHWWADPTTGHEAMVRWRLYLFFWPVDEQRTTVMTFAYAKSRYPGPAGGLRLFRWLMRRNLNYEINLDVDILRNLADKNPSIEGMKLSRFDKVLGLNRERIDRIYRGRGTTSPLTLYSEAG